MELLQWGSHHLDFLLLPILVTRHTRFFPLDEVVLVAVAELAVFVSEFVDHAFRHGGPEQSWGPAVFVDFDPESVVVVVFFYGRGDLWEGDVFSRFEAGDVALLDSAAPGSVGPFGDFLFGEFFDDYVASDAGFRV